MPETIRNTSGTFEMRWPEIPLLVPEAAKKVIADIERETVHQALLILAGRVSETAPRNFGHLAQSFGAMPATAEGGIEILNNASTSTGIIGGRVFSSLPQAIVMEEGRQPGPISRSGIASLGLWVQRKLGLSGKEAQSATWAIATAITQRGLPARWYAKQAFSQAQPELKQLFDEAAVGIRDGLMGGRS